MTEIEKTKKEIEVLTAKLALLKEMENHKTPCEIAYKDWWGQYPETGSWDSFDDTRWQGFQAGYEFAYAISTAKEVMEQVQEEQEVEPYNLELPAVEYNRKMNEVKKLQEKEWTYKITDEKGEINSYKQHMYNVKNLEENNWYVDAKSLVKPPTLWERFYGEKWNTTACNKFCEIVEQWLNDNTTTLEEDYHTVTLKLKKGMLVNSND